jgi:hypothetical protein
MGRDRTIVSRLRAVSAHPLPAEPLEQRVLFSSVVGRFLFYNNSAFDAHDPGVNEQDLGAVAIDKEALRPGLKASFQNYTSYSRGINGLEVDLAGETGTPTVDSFEFKVGTGGDPASWPAAPAPTQMVRLAPAAPEEPARYLFAWSDGAIANQWLRVTVKANAETGLAAPDVFYFGNLVGETGDKAAEAAVDTADYATVRRRMKGRGAGLTEPSDFNRDRAVNAADLAIVRGRLFKPPLPLITAPPRPGDAAPTVAVQSPAAGSVVYGLV